MKYIFKRLVLIVIIFIGWPVTIIKHALLNVCALIWFVDTAALEPYTKELFYISGLDYKLINGKWHFKYYTSVKDYLAEKETWIEDTNSL